jgi:preprotein translocase subunit Sec63
MSSSANPSMGDTSDPSKQNNELFKIENLFNVKPRVALVTGKFLIKEDNIVHDSC